MSLFQTLRAFGGRIARQTSFKHTADYYVPALLSHSNQIGRHRHKALHVCAAGVKTKTIYKCSDCGQTSPQFTGRCLSCNKYNTMEKEEVVTSSASTKTGGGGGAAAAIRMAGLSQRQARPFEYEEPDFEDEQNVMSQQGIKRKGWVTGADRPQRIGDVRKQGFERWKLPLAGPTGAELSRVLGGGVVPGSLTLIGGDPGVGKSTLLLQLAGILAAIPPDKSSHEDSPVAASQAVLYASAEESEDQVASRSERMGLDENLDVYIYSATRLWDIMNWINNIQPRAVIVDSIQTVYLDDVNGSSGSISQVRECATALLHVAKKSRVPIFLVGHVTKQGDIAGPRVLEHIVDCVLYMEGERQQTFRLIRGIKNRFGATDEVGVFTMDESGLNPVANPSALFLSDRSQPSGVSSAVSVTMEGTRPLLLEIQALCTPVHEKGMGPPLRAPNGVDRNRLFQILAVLEKYARIQTYAVNMHINVVGGLKVSEPATDLALAVAIASSIREQPVPNDMAFVGELGLGGELRAVSRLEQRLLEASKLGFTSCVIPKGGPALNEKRLQGMRLIGCANIDQALRAAIGGGH